MTETLVIRLRASEDAPASWLIVDANGARSGNVQSGPIADALALSQGRRTVVVRKVNHSARMSRRFLTWGRWSSPIMLRLTR